MSGLFRRAQKRQVDPASLYFERTRSSAYGRPAPRDQWQSLRRPRNQLIALVLASGLAVGGVFATIQITIYGNNSTVAGQLSLGVGQAIATSCDQSTNVHTDTIGNYVDNPYYDFILQQVNVSQVDPNCGGKLMNLVIRLNNAPDVNLSCNLPASNAFSPNTFSQATFAFATSSITTSSLLYQCSNGVPNGTYLASIAASAVQIK